MARSALVVEAGVSRTMSVLQRMAIASGAARMFNLRSDEDFLSWPVDRSLAAVPTPSILPPHLPNCAVTFDDAVTVDRVDGIELPPELEHAVPSRRMQFLAGRYCAARALERLGGFRAEVGRTLSGSPIWPSGIVGAITHTRGFAWAAVAAQKHVAGLGIDSERLIPEERAERISATTLLPAEVTRGEQLMTRAEWITLAFSAKESLFKCVHPLVGRYFHYADAEIVAIDGRSGAINIVLHRDLSRRFAAGTILRGRYHIGGGLVHTAVVMPAL
jgi:enterobactin synthetase component D / holo-[acyl-carrier protein] synthase